VASTDSKTNSCWKTQTLIILVAHIYHVFPTAGASNTQICCCKLHLLLLYADDEEAAAAARLSEKLEL
jgi:hypothetical protein